MKKKIVLLTGNELRHKYFASFLASHSNINMKLVIHESNIKLKKNILYKNDRIIKKYVDLREKTEKIYFKNYIKNTKPYYYVKIKNGYINNDKIIKIIKAIKFDYLISFGSSIIKPKLINLFKKKFLNIHLGLSPYYKGSGTNFFPFVNNELQFCGSTIMQISEKLDDGKIVHQIRPIFQVNDTIHTIGNKIIQETANDLCKILIKIKKIKYFKIKTNYKSKIFKRRDFNRFVLDRALANIENGMILNYISKYKILMEKRYPIKKQL
jgi:folate-dependent phosphoribosylglycinamide formyltransferase PurN